MYTLLLKLCSLASLHFSWFYYVFGNSLAAFVALVKILLSWNIAQVLIPFLFFFFSMLVFA